MSSNNKRVEDWTFEEIRSQVSGVVTSVKQKVTRKICSRWNRKALTMEWVSDYCDWNKEVQLWFRPLPGNLKGLAVHRHGLFILVCNERIQDPLVRLKVVLHELGHYLLHRPFLESGGVSKSTDTWFFDEFEKEANLFALMGMAPDSEIEQVLADHDGLKTVIQEVTRAYAFSPEEAIVRLAVIDENLRHNSYEATFRHFVECVGGDGSFEVTDWFLER